MTSRNFGRRHFLGAAGASAAGLLATSVGGGVSPATAAVGDGWDTQALLQKLMDMRFGMFNHFNLGTYTNQEGPLPTRTPQSSHPRRWTLISGPMPLSPQG
ncbi:hypothetical protein ACW0JT_05430 [Arthrobacter sp. SA17]